MKIEFEILEADIADRNILIGIRADVEAQITRLSKYGRNTLFDELNALRGKIEWCENVWLSAQKDRAINLVSQALNIKRMEHGDEEWRDD